MTKKHFDMIARIIKDSIDSVPEYDLRAINQSKYIAHTLCCELAKANTRFDKDRFLKACGLDTN